MPYVIDPQTGYQVWQDEAKNPMKGAARYLQQTYGNGGGLSDYVSEVIASRPQYKSGGGYTAPYSTALSGAGGGYDTFGGNVPAQLGRFDQTGAFGAGLPAVGDRSPIQNPGNNLTNPGYDEQAF